MTINHENLDKVLLSLDSHINAKLLIVSKNRSVTDINELIDKGFKLFGENRVQEAKSKFSNLDGLELHLIGPLQTNKVKDALQLFNVIQSIDRKKLIDEISKSKSKLEDIKTTSYYIQVNIGLEKQKAGIDKLKVADLYEYACKNNLKIDGLMCIPPNTINPEPYFEEMIKIKDTINKNLKLSMGMSNDYLIALKHNSSLIRIGSLIFND